MKDRKYKLKEEVKKYCVASHRDREMSHDDWGKKGFNKESFEEVEEVKGVEYVVRVSGDYLYKVEEITSVMSLTIDCVGGGYGHFIDSSKILQKNIQNFLNGNYGEIEELCKVVEAYVKYCNVCRKSGVATIEGVRPVDPFIFSYWLKNIYND